MNTNPNANDIKLSMRLYEEAKEKNLTLSALLETIDPSQQEDKLDAFERQLKRFEIVTKADPDKGIFPSRGELFFASNLPESRILFPEFINRTIRAAMMDDTDILSYLVAGWDIDNSGVYRSVYLDDTATKRKSGRRAEGAKAAPMKVTWSEKAQSLKDYAIEVDMSYEFIRRAPVTLIQTILKRVALQRRLDEAAEALYVIINGDGTGKEGDAISNTNLSDLGVTNPAGTKDLAYRAYLLWLATFMPMAATTIVGYTTDIVDYIVMAKPSTDPIFLYNLLDKSKTGGVPTLVNLNYGSIAAITHEDVSTNLLIALDKRFALQGHRETGTDLVETDRLISAKWEKIVISNKVGFSKIFASASKKLTTNA